MTDDSEALTRLLAYHDHIAAPPVAVADDVRRGRRRVRRTRTLVASGAALAVATAVATGALLSGGDPVSAPPPLVQTPTPTASPTVTPGPGWPGAVRDGRAWAQVTPERDAAGTDQATDAGGGIVDIRSVNAGPREFGDGTRVTGEWRIRFAEGWPGGTEIGPSDGVVEYGVVVDTDDDRVADCRIGINDDAPRVGSKGQYRVWVTNIDEGRTEEQVGPPYGIPIDFALPDEIGAPFLYFFFVALGGPCDFRGAISYYAYAVVTDPQGNVTASDFAPDASWLVASRGGTS